MSISERVNSEILDILYDPAHRQLVQGRPMPAMYPALVEGGLVSIGINPGYSPTKFNPLLRDATERASYELESVCRWQEERADFNVDRMVAVEAIARERYPFYAVFKRIASRLGLEWQHVDVFPMRTKEQGGLDPIVGRLPHRLNQFGERWVRLFRTHMLLVSPDLVLVTNVTAGRLFERHCSAVYDDEVGHHWADGIPCFIAGAKSFDGYSETRLVWHMRRCLAERRHAND